MNFNTEPDEEIKLEQLRFELIEEDERLKVQETKVRLFFEKVKLENDKINKERRQVERETEELRKREQIMLEAREGLQEEKEALQKEWIDVEKMRNGLNLNFALLKMEKIRIRAKRKVVEREKNRVFKNLKGIWDKRERGNEFCFEKGYDGDRD